MGILKAFPILAVFFLSLSDANASTGNSNYAFPFVGKWLLIFCVWTLIYLLLRKNWLEEGKGVLLWHAARLQYWSQLAAMFPMLVILLLGSAMFVIPVVILFFASMLIGGILLFSLVLGICVKLSSRGRIMFCLQACCLVLLTGSVWHGYWRRGPPPREIARRIVCLNQLRSIGLSLAQYSLDNNDFYPDMNNAKGLELVIKSGYLNDTRFFVCPSSMTEPGKELREENLSYNYRGGFKHEPGGMRRPIMWDKPGNHNDYGNVLYTDGGVESFKGPDWMKKAGIETDSGRKR